LDFTAAWRPDALKKKSDHKRTHVRGAKSAQRGDVMPIKSLIRGRRPAADKKPAVPAKKSQEAAEATIDFPQEGELVVPGHYAVRITAQPGFDVEISTDGKIWQFTRPSVGFHWFDWYPAKPGRTVLSVRVKSGKSRWKTASERECVVLDRPAN
jgi:hypothetical protein